MSSLIEAKYASITNQDGSEHSEEQKTTNLICRFKWRVARLKSQRLGPRVKAPVHLRDSVDFRRLT